MKIEIPKNCPSCDYELELVNSQLFCRNTECKAQSSKKLEAFAKAMKIKGLGPQTIKKLELINIDDIYKLRLEDLEVVLGEKLANKLLDQIEHSKTNKFSTVLASLSIPLIGKVTAEKIAAIAKNFEDIIYYRDRLPIGDKARLSLLTWLNENLPLDFIKTFNLKEELDTTKLKGTVCITGKLSNYKNRAEASKHLEQEGYKVVSTVTKSTDYLVDEEGKPSSKRSKAENLNIKIVKMTELI